MTLRARAIKGVAWYTAIRIATQALSWGVTIIVARLLSPEDYGLFGMSFVVISFLRLFQEFGLGTAVIQRQKLDPRELNGIFWIIFLTSTVLTAVAFGVSGLAGHFYDDPKVTDIVRILAVVFLLNSVGTVPYSLLTKELDFRKRSLADALGTIGSSATSLVLAYQGYGVWALVGGVLVRAVLRNLALCLASGWFPGLETSFQNIRELLGFGVRVASSTIIRYSSDAFNIAILGKFLGRDAVGLFSMAETLGKNNPVHRLTTAILNQVSLPVFAKLQNVEDELRTYFLTICRYIALMALPLQVGMALVAEDVVLILLTEKWSGAVFLIQLFSVGGIFSVLPLPSAPLLTARGKVASVLRYSWVLAMSMALVFLAASQWSVEVVVIGWVAVFPIVRSQLLRMSLEEVGLTFREYIHAISVPLLATITMIFAVVLTALSIEGAGPTVGALSAKVGIGALVYSGTILVLDRDIAHDLRIVMRDLRSVSSG